MTTYGWLQDGGGTEFPRSLAKAIVRKNIEVIVVAAEEIHSANRTPYFVEKSIDDGVELYKIFNRATTFLDADNPRREITDEHILEIFNRIIQTEKPDLVHFHNFLGLSFAISDIPKRMGIPSIFTAHNFHLIDPELYMFHYHDRLAKWESLDLIENSKLIIKHPQLKLDYKIRQEVARKILRENIDVFIAPSQRYAQIYNEFAGIYNKTVVLNQISEVCNYHIAKTKDFSGKFRIGYLGSIYPHKGVHLIYQAAEILSDYDIEFCLFGSAVIEYINNLINKYPNTKVKYMGSYRTSDLVDISKDLDCTIISSILEEAGPLVAPEALSLGLPIIGANIGGIPDFIVDGLNGKLYSYNDSTDLAKVIKFLFQNPDELKRMQLNAYLPYNFDDYVDNLVELYIDLIQNRENSQPKNYQLIFSSKLVNRAGDLFENNSSKNIFDDEDLLQLIDIGLTKEINKIDQISNINISDPFRPILVNLASQGEILPGFINIDKNPRKESEIKGDIRKLDFDDNSVELMIAKNILQVFSHREFQKILLEWKRVLKPGGTLILSVPDLKSILKAYIIGTIDFKETQEGLFGKQVNEYEYFYNGFDQNSLANNLNKLGFKVVDLQIIKMNSSKFEEIFVRCVKEY